MKSLILKEAINHRNQMGICSLICIILCVGTPFISSKPLPSIVPIAGGIFLVLWLHMISVVKNLKESEPNE